MKNFEQFASTLVSRLGQDVVILNAEEVEATTRTCIPYRNLSSAVVYPTSIDQVKEVVQLANEYSVPIWTVSTGKNWGYGEKTACYPGGVTLILERMNRIIEVNEKLGYAVIEAGVTYRQLNDYLKKHKIKLWADVTGSTESASVIGNALDKGRGLSPYADHFAALCGLDVVLPDGEFLHTGGGYPERNNVRHTYKWGLGPYLDGLFAQSNFGIVVSGGVWLMHEPEVFDWGAFEYTASPDRFGMLIDELQTLLATGALRSHPHLANEFAMMCIIAQYPKELLNGRKRLSPEAMTAWRKRHGVQRWTCGCGFYGSKEEVKYQKRRTKKVFRRYGMFQFLGVAAEDTIIGRLARFFMPLVNRLLGKSSAFVEALIPAINLYKGIPTDFFARQVYFKSHAEKPLENIDPARDGCGFVWIGPVVPFTATDVERGLSLGYAIFDEYEFDPFVEVIIESQRSVILLMGVFYDKNDASEAERAKAWYEKMSNTFFSEGYPPYREATSKMIGSLDCNPPLKQFLTTIKGAIDPKGVIAPGRYGIQLKQKGK